MSNKTSDKNVAEDRVIAIKFAVMQQQINEKDKRIQELEEEVLDERERAMHYEEDYQKAKDEQKIIMANSIPKQVVIDKMEELNKEIKSCDEIDAIFKIKQQQVLQELLEGERK